MIKNSILKKRRNIMSRKTEVKEYVKVYEDELFNDLLHNLEDDGYKNLFIDKMKDLPEELKDELSGEVFNNLPTDMDPIAADFDQCAGSLFDRLQKHLIEDGSLKVEESQDNGGK
jgi:hypothetical protein